MLSNVTQVMCVDIGTTILIDVRISQNCKKTRTTTFRYKRLRSAKLTYIGSL